MLRRKLINTLPAPLFRSQMIAGWQNVGDIISAIQDQHKRSLPEAAKIAKYFRGSNERETARNIFNFLKSETQYRVESSNKQTTKTLSRFLHDGYGDCKHYSLFICTIMSVCGYRCLYRFAGYRGKDLTHVYCVLPNSNTIVDAVLPYFDSEKTPVYKKDIDMSLYRLSGIDQDGTGNYDAAASYDAVGALNFTKIKQGVQKAAAKGSNVVKKAAASVPALAKKVASTTATATLVIPRNAFLGLVKLNFSGLGGDMNRILTTKGESAFGWWKDLGGDLDNLKKAITEGSQKKRIMGVDEETDSFREIFGGYSGTGVYVGEPVTIASAIASATPILIKVKAWMAKNGVDTAKVAKAVETGKSTFQKVTGKKVEDVIFKKDSGVQNSKMTLSAGDLSATTEATARAIATQAVAMATEVPKETIKEMVAEAESNGTAAQTILPAAPSPDQPMLPALPRIITPPVPAKPGFDFKALLTQRNLLIAGGVLAVVYLMRK
jgi:hypothetical protein